MKIEIVFFVHCDMVLLRVLFGELAGDEVYDVF